MSRGAWRRLAVHYHYLPFLHRFPWHSSPPSSPLQTRSGRPHLSASFAAQSTRTKSARRRKLASLSNPVVVEGTYCSTRVDLGTLLEYNFGRSLGPLFAIGRLEVLDQVPIPLVG